MPAPTEITRQLDSALSQLRAQVRRYVVLEGLALVVAVIGLGFWLGYFADELHFGARRLELPKWIRLAFTIVVAGVAATVFFTWVVGRLWTRFGRKMLAIVLERRFPQLGDRLITAVELQASPRVHESPLSELMWQRTASQAAEALKGVNLNDVFNPRPLKRALVVAGVLLASIAVMGTANAAGVQRWFNAFILGRDDYWEPYRKSAMSVRVIAEPGKRVREFDADGIYRHPRGVDLTIEAESAEGKVSPERATLSFRSFGTSGVARGSAPMSRGGDRTFRTTLSRVIDDHELWVTAGDYVNRHPFRIQIVEPPRIDRIELHCDYPGYTGLDAVEDRPVLVQSLQTSLPMETAFELRATANKPLVAAVIRCEQFELRFRRNSPGGSSDEHRPVLIVRDAADGTARTVQLGGTDHWFAEDGLTFRAPMKVSLKGVEELASLTEGALPPIPIPPVAPLQILLEDEDDVFSTEPTSLTITGVADLDPVVDVRLSGVSNVVTRLAELPVRGRITDDYGVRKAEFGYEILPDPADAAEGVKAAALKLVPLKLQPANQREFAVGPEGAGERFSLTPLELRDGQRLQLSVYAEDGDDRNGPHRARGEVFTLRVVPGEELLSRLYEKELNLRQRFEQIITETKRVRDDLKQHEDRAAEWKGAKAAGEEEKSSSLYNAIDASARRSLHQVRTNQTESRAIEVAFGEIREEMVNNRVDTPALLDRIDRGVVAPLHTINESDYPDLDGLLALFALATERNEDPSARIAPAREAVERLIARMEQVLSEMQRRGNVNEIIQQLQNIIERQEKLRDATEQRKLDELFEDIGKP
ncbi:hypothetical protein Pan44_24720 [Caulifigura coniformis]|uniref:Polyketide synthase n=1 Tax=Caulifigura coniformis TaxID=2527983 RepID=A0A517SE81_9PLAN|nr:hypothetical protein [Caulifigura coniformis]QDT54439.1 hypothetical protein Pan44_24720 [Caulifigura coniformis]